MGLIKSFVAERRSLDVNPLDPRWWPNTMNYHVNSGAMVSEETAMRIGTVWACVRLLSWTQASLPWHIYKHMQPRGKQLATAHRNYYMLYKRPNSEQSSFTFRSTEMAHQLLWGNAYAEIEYDNDGFPVALWPLPPWRTKPLRTVKGELFYRVTLPDGNTKNLPPYQIWHVLNLSTDGIKGLSIVSQAREALGLSIATEEFGARYFGNGTNIGGVVEHPGKLSTNAHNSLRADMQEKYEGLGRSHRLMLLEEGMKFQKIGIPPNDSQFLETRQFQVEEICRWFGVQPHLVMDLSRATNNNIEHQGLEFVTYTMRPHAINWEQETDFKLFGIDSPYFNEFLLDGLMRGDLLSRYQAYAVARQWGWYSANDIRELENQNPLPGTQGEIYMTPLNMVDASTLAAPGTKPDSQIDDPLQTNSLTIPTEKRSLEYRRRAANLRQKTAASYQRLFHDAGQRIVDREKQNVGRAAAKYLGARSKDDFKNWMNDYYRDYQDYMQRQILPVAQSLADAIQPLAGEEVNAQLEHVNPHVAQFVNDYVSTFGVRYAETSKGQLMGIIEKNDGDAGDEVVRRLDDWEATRADQVARNETVQLSNAIARMIFQTAGISKLRWACNSSKPCEFCKQMHDKVSPIDTPFLLKGDKLSDGSRELEIPHNVRHPPLHQSCSDCVIMPEY